MATKSGQDAASAEQVEELLDAVDSTLDRLKTLYEQYFLGIQKQAPAFVHNDVERKLRDLTQMNIRATRLRYRLATLQQKFGSYNAYWRRTLRQIENGTYARNLAKIGREAARTGSEIPEEILAAMPKRMREQVLRDRDAAIALAKRRQQLEEPAADELLTLADEGEPAMIEDAPPVRRDVKTRSGAHVLSEEDGDIDFNALFSAFEDDAPKTIEPTATQAITRPVTRPPMPRMPVPPTGRHAAQPARVGPPQTPPAGTPAGAPTQTPPAGMPIAALRLKQQPVTGAVPRPAAQTPSGPTQGARPDAPRAPNDPRVTQPIPRPPAPRPAPSQQSRPVPVIPGAAAATGPVAVESMSGPFPRTPAEKAGPTTQVPKTAAQTTPIPRPPAPGTRTTQAMPRPGQPASLKPPPGMSEADVNALHAKYVKAKEMVGEKVDPGSREKLLKTINQTAPKIMEQYKASGVDFSVVVKDNQVVIKAKPKT
ncbi:MAG TPA: MXAN_5187 C-terminal domain-containing protein [Kofleriaceae bacterium]|nr:MXAN_5187 C-terminal domain-containing protein [Kofleriaceae bacterium]